MAAVEQLAGRDKVDAFIGTYISAVSNAASEAALNNGKLYWDTNALAAQLTELRKNGPDALPLYLRNIRLALYAKASHIILEMKN